MDKIKHFFDQKKAKVKFALLKDGKKLSSTSHQHQQPSAVHSKNVTQQGRLEQTVDARRAGEAAMARLADKNNPRVPAASSTYMKLKSQIEAEMIAEASVSSKTGNSPVEVKEVLKDGPKLLEVRGIFFTCPLVGSEIATYNEIKEKIGIFLEEQLHTQDPSMAAALMIQSLNNKDREKVHKCIELLSKYLENIIANPTEEKFAKIRMLNKNLQEKVFPIRGSFEFLQAVGFEVVKVETENLSEEFLIMPESRRTSPDLKEKLDVLLLSEPIIPVLDRGLKVFFPSPNAGRFMDLPEDFYTISKDELRREMQMKQEEMEKLGMLRTKAMRERDAQRELRRYKCSLLRFRFPDQTILQATFWSTETAKELCEFVKEHIEPEWAPYTFGCRSSQGTQLSLSEDSPGSIAEHGLCPSSIINIIFDADLMEQCNREHIPPPRLKSTTLELIQPLSN